MNSIPAFTFDEGRDGLTMSFDVTDAIVEQTKRIHEVMETAARDDVIAWLRTHGYVVEEPGWEYGCAVRGADGRLRQPFRHDDLESARQELADDADMYKPDTLVLVRRTPGRAAGPWEEVPDLDTRDTPTDNPPSE